MGASIRARRAASQQAAAQTALQQRQLEALERAQARADLQAEASARASADAVAIINAETERIRAANAQAAAAARRLFLGRWLPLVTDIADSVGFESSLRMAFMEHAEDVAADLWLVDRQASTAAMRDALLPVASTLTRDFQRFVETIVRPSEGDIARARFTRAQLNTVVLPRVREVAADCFAVGQRWTAAEFRDYELVPLLQRLRSEIDADHAFADSIRRADAQRRQPATLRRAKPASTRP